MSTLNQQSKLSYINPDQIELAFFGFIRKNYNQNFPDVIKQICITYYPKIEVFWDIYYDELSKYVSDDGLICRGQSNGGYTTFSCSNGWNKGVHIFTVKSINGNMHSCGIGITSSENLKKIEHVNDLYFLWSNTDECVLYCMDGQRIFKKDTNVNYNYKMIKQCEQFNNSAAITIMVDCNKWKLQYYANGKIIADDMDLERNKTYHACITIFSSNLTYKIVQNPHIDLL